MATAVEVLIELFPSLRDRGGAGAQDAGGYLADEVLEDLLGVFGWEDHPHDAGVGGAHAHRAERRVVRPRTATSTRSSESARAANRARTAIPVGNRCLGAAAQKTFDPRVLMGVVRHGG